MKITLFVFLGVSTFTLCSCFQSRQILKIKEKIENQDGITSEEITINGLSHSELSDQYFSVLPTFGICAPNSGFLALGVKANYTHLSIGDFKVEALAIPSLLGKFKDPQLSPTVSKSKLGISYEFPVLKFKGKKERIVPLSTEPRTDQGYFTIMDLSYHNIFSLKGGVVYQWNTFATTQYADIIRQEYGDVTFDNSFNTGEMDVFAGTIQGKFGISYSKFFGTNFKAKGAEYDFIGALFRKLNIYAELRVPIKSRTSKVIFDFRYYDEETSTLIDVIHHVDPTTFLKKNWVGFAAGAEYNFYFTPFSNISTAISLEVSSVPGYWGKFSQSLYFEYGLQIGFGKGIKK